MKKEEITFWYYIIGCITSIILMIAIIDNIQLKVSRSTTSFIFYSFTALTIILLFLALLTYYKNPDMFKERNKNKVNLDTHEERLAKIKSFQENNLEKTQIKCPYCKSTNIEFLGNNKKSFSVGKAAAGAVLTGGIGTLAGFAGKKGNNQWFCKKCNQIFETKK